MFQEIAIIKVYEILVHVHVHAPRHLSSSSVQGVAGQKSWVAAEMGDRLATTNMGQKLGPVPLWEGSRVVPNHGYNFVNCKFLILKFSNVMQQHT